DHVTVDVDGTPYLLTHEVAAGQDFYDEDWRAYTRAVRARAFALGWQTGTTYAPDPVAALRAWTDIQWPGQLQTDPTNWDPSDATPGLYWRLAGVTVAERGQRAWGAWMDATLRAHVVAPSESARLTWARRAVETLAYTHRLTLSDGSPLFFRELAADHEADPFRTGQVRLLGRFGVLTPPPVPAPEPINVTEPITLVTQFP
ncbi:MAG: 3'-phosphoadenosine 5'-phosphosulfate sulfotransferase, partial [Chloroflexota bacterium]